MQSATIRTLLNRGRAVLTEHGVPNAQRNVEWMLSHALSCSTLDLYVRSTDVPERVASAAFWNCVQRRAAREPLQYILGQTEFMSLPFLTAAGVFVPRPDTERLVELAEERLVSSERTHLRMLDLCCGSGVIAVSLLSRLPHLRAAAVDVSEPAAGLTQRNAALNQVTHRLEVVWMEAARFLGTSAEPYDAILCNPPYIRSGDVDNLPPEVRDHEPAAALDGGPDGADFYRAVIPLMTRRLSPDGWVAFEIGDDQGEAVSGLLGEGSYRSVRVYEDHAGRDRVVIASAPAKV